MVPTLNVRSSLPEHLASLSTWAGLVQEIIVVDSQSTDGTVEFLKSELHHPRLRLLQCPPGLYRAWNYAIQQLTSEFAYISTVGDTITAEGLKHLVTTAQALHSDVVVSPPQLLNSNGQSVVDKHWPIHAFLKECAIDQPVRLSQPLAFLLATRYVPESILGSSASNLYLAETLKRFPFPTDFGHVGDTAWGIRTAFRISLTVTPKTFSRFIFHRNDRVLPETEKQALVGRLLDLARQTVRELPNPSLRTEHQSRTTHLVQALPDEIQKLHEAQWSYDRARRESRPWISSPTAWRARSQRNRQRTRLHRTQREIWRLCRPDAT